MNIVTSPKKFVPKKAFSELDEKYLDGYLSFRLKKSKLEFVLGSNEVIKTRKGYLVSAKTLEGMKHAMATIIVYLFKAPMRIVDCLVKTLFNESLNKIDLPCITKSKLPLKEHQKLVVKHFQKHRGLIAIHVVGSGKTLSSVTAGECFLASNPKGKVIVVTPTSLQANFKKEMKSYDPNIKMKRYEFYTIDGFSRASSKGEIDCKDVMLIIDEAHNIRTKVTTTKSGAVKGIKALNLLKCAALDNAKKVLLLTATPIVNEPYDLENLVSIVDGRDPMKLKEFEEILYHPASFDRHFRCKISIFEPDAKETKQFYPDSKIHEIFIPMPFDYEKRYMDIEEAISEAKGRTKTGKKAELGSFFSGLRQASNKLDDTIDSPKIKWLEHFIDTHPKGKMVIFSHWLDAGLNSVKDLLKTKGIKFLHIDGSLNQAKRKEAVLRYNSDKIRVLLISKAGGEGLDLKATRYMILMDPGWNPSTALQVIGRSVRFKSHSHLPLPEQIVDVYKLFLVKREERKAIDSGEKYDKLDEMKEAVEKPAVDLYLRALAIRKDKMIDETINRLRPLSIEQSRC